MKNPFAYANKIRKKSKDPYWVAKNKYITYYDRLPIDEKVILLESQSATKISGNLFYILKYLLTDEKYAGYTVYLSSWGRYVNSITAILEHYGIENVNIVVYASDDYMRLLASAKYLINDATFPNYWIKKEGQVYINTWHGTPLKAMGRKVHNDVFFGNVQKNLVNADYLLYPNIFTKDVMIRDYMLENISSNSYILGGYPRNTVFFDRNTESRIREELEITDKKIYAYMPTWRGTVDKVGVSKNDAYLMYYLCELDKRLTDDEIFYINIHPMAMHAKNTAEVSKLKHIKNFPAEYETYDFLNIADVLVTDYSSVFFDYACTRKKVVLFPYDKDEYLCDRGMYIDMDDLPFPQVFDLDALVDELRSEKNYDDTEFVKTFCTWDNIDATAQLCDRTILGIDTGLTVAPVPNNGKENVLIYAGDLAKNGITTSLRSLTNEIDLNKRNYYISFIQGKAKKNADQLVTFNPKVNFFAVSDYFNLSFKDKAIRKLFNLGIIKAKTYMKHAKTRVQQNFIRAYGQSKFDTVIQFCGYERDLILLYSRFDGNNAIWVHNDMVAEMKLKSNQRKDILRYAYNNYNKVVAVTDDIVASTQKLAGTDKKIDIVKNTIDYKTILANSEQPIALDPTTKCSVEPEKFYEIMQSDAKKFINIGRYSPEKGHDRLIDAFYKIWQKDNSIYLIIIGGNSRANKYEELVEKVNEMGLSENVILLLSVSNPYPIIKACNGFILSSLYEGFGLVLAEANILGLPIVSTDITGPRTFMNKYGGTLVEDSEDGVYKGLEMLYNNEIKPINVDYEAYNRECVAEFEKLFE